MKPSTIEPPLSNVQLELLKLYAAGVPDETLLELKTIIARFFLERIRKSSDAVWEEKDYSDDYFQSVD